VSPVHLELNSDGTRMVASCYSNGDVTIWDISNGDLKVVKTLHTNGDPIGPGQTVARAHQTVMEPSGRFFATNNLGTDTIVIIDGKDDNWDIVNRVRVEPAGCGPRHGAFYPLGAEQATHYMVVCENQNLVHVYSVTYTDSLLELSPVQTVSTFSQSTTANITSARAAELVLSPENTDVYVSNRLTVFNATDGDQDSVVHFKIVTGSNGTAAAEADGCAAVTDTTGSGMMLKTVEEVPSAGFNPRFIGLGTDADILYVANVGAGPAGLAAFARNKDDGKISTDVMGSIDYAVFGEGPGWGPQFVKQI
jgi:6-phosphogluconolactonase (cycloisomerase 2 family)